MEDYELKYEEYKNTLLKSWYFTDRLKKKYEDTLSLEKNYIDQNGVLWKIGILSAVCGICFAFCAVSEGRDDTAAAIWRIVPTIFGIASFLLAMYIGSKYKKASGKRNFYSFQYDSYIKDRVHEDKEKETDKLLRDMLDKIDSIQWRAELLEEGTQGNSELLQDNLLYIIKVSSDFQKRYDQLTKYNRFAEDLIIDFYFSKSIHELFKEEE